MNIEKIKELLRTIKKADYRDYFAAVLLNEKIDYMQDIEDLTEKDLKYIDGIYDNYISNDFIKLLSDEIMGKLEEE